MKNKSTIANFISLRPLVGGRQETVVVNKTASWRPTTVSCLPSTRLRTHSIENHYYQFFFFVSLRLCVSLVLFMSLLISVQAQQAQISAKQNPQIEKILSEISAANIEANISKISQLRHASYAVISGRSEAWHRSRATWIKSEFDRYSKESGGRLIVSEDDFIQPAGATRSATNALVNIVGTLAGQTSRIQRSSVCRQWALRFVCVHAKHDWMRRATLRARAMTLRAQRQ